MKAGKPTPQCSPRWCVLSQPLQDEDLALLVSMLSNTSDFVVYVIILNIHLLHI